MEKVFNSSEFLGRDKKPASATKRGQRLYIVMPPPWKRLLIKSVSVEKTVERAAKAIHYATKFDPDKKSSSFRARAVPASKGAVSSGRCRASHAVIFWACR